MRHVILEKSWDESKHPRVPSGSGSGGQFAGADSAAAPTTKAALVEKIANDMARALEFDGAVVVHPETDEYHFKVGALNFKAVATYTAASNRIDVYSGFFKTDEDVKAILPGFMAHEVQHARFDAVVKALSEAREQVMNDPRTMDDMRPDGTLRTLGTEHPIYQGFAEFDDKYSFSDLQKHDGVTPYSAAYWKPEALALNGSAIRARDETLAEIARLVHEDKANMKKVAKPWRDYYNLFLKTYKGFRK